ncbi:uncharacterized protein LOC118433942 [Folsomia candida]|nr:uncharacterized protein LOC118433942 [Folsomia candida]
MIDQMVDLVEENVNANLSLWILPNFTTTTRNDIVTSGIILLATVQKYFTYNFARASCGIPQITLLGRREDWIEIRERIDKLPNFDLEGASLMKEWSSQFGLVLDQFIKVKTTGQVDHEFWDGIVLHGAYSGRCTSEDFVDGWITVFSPFNQNGEWIGKRSTNLRYKDRCTIEKDKVTEAVAGGPGEQDRLLRMFYPKELTSPWNKIDLKSVMEVENRVMFPLRIKDDNAVDLEGGEYEGTVHAGYMGHSVEEDEVTLKPIMGWVVALHGKRPAYLDRRRLGEKNILKF